MNNVTTFNFNKNQVRTVVIDDEPYFIGKEIAKILGYKNTRTALSNHVDEEDKTTVLLEDTGSNYKSNTVLINESGLYSLILGSSIPEAKTFKRWVTSEVLPAIRKHGAYLTDKKAYDITHDSDSLADLLLQAGEQLKQKDLIIQEMKPKALFADSVSVSQTNILVSELAKLLKQNGVETGGNRLFQWLRDNGYLIKRQGTDYNAPTQKSLELGLFSVKETSIQHSDGHVTINKTTKVTGKGQQYFINKFLAQEQPA